MFDRRSLLTGAAALALAGPIRALAQELTGPDPTFDLGRTAGTPKFATDALLDPAVRASRIAWLQANAAPLRSTDMADDDFADLEPLRRAIGDARIVLLGEQTHGDGTTFAAKSRLIRFLHERVGFDVLAFESGFYDMPKVWKRIRAGEPARSATRSGLYPLWSFSREVQPLIDYVGERARSSRPLELTGFDCKFTNYGSASAHFADELVAVLAASGVDTPSIAGWRRFRDVIEILSDSSNPGKWKPSEVDHRLVVETADNLIDRLAAAPGADAAYWRQMLKSTKGQSNFLLKADFTKDRLDDVMLRDVPMGDNLVWLARELYPQRKIIVWAGTLHTCRNLHLMDPGLKDVRLMGDFVWEAFGEKTYSIGFTTCEGVRGAVGQGETPVVPVDPDSFEGLWGATAQSSAFLDLRKVSTGGEWLDEPIVSSLLNSQAYPMHVRRHFDASVFLRTMRRATQAE